MITDYPFAVLIVAGGASTRMRDDIPKQYQLLAGQSLLRRTIKAWQEISGDAPIQVAIHAEHEAFFKEACGDLGILPPVTGGLSRQESVFKGLQALSQLSPAHVMIHDAARPFFTAEIVARVRAALKENKAVIPAQVMTETIKRTDGTLVKETVPREGLVAVQTPQGFDFTTILNAHQNMQGRELTDDAGVCEAAGIPVRFVAGDADNIKITTKEDMKLAERRMGQSMEIRVGQGIDVHRMVTHRGAERHVLRLGGIDLPSTKCLEGHSDADAVLHAIVDAILGAIGEGDIGVYFPCNDPKWKGVDSAVFVEEAMRQLKQLGGSIVNLDVTILCEIPKINPHRETMRGRVAEIMGVDPSRVNIKATTTESLGFLGRKEGLCAQAVVSIKLPA